MTSTEIYLALARYNGWMNEKLLAACAQLSDAERRQPWGVPFKSLHGLWNHLLVADRIWMARIEGRPVPYTALDVEVCADFEALRQERALTDAALSVMVAAWSPAHLAAPFSYVSLSNPQRRTSPLWVYATHLFNHQTHHRGQISALLEHLGGDCGVTDFLALPGLQITE